MKTKKLPKKVFDYIDRSVTFSIYGLVNLGKLRSLTGTKLKTSELKKRINLEFGKEFDHTIEFLGK